MCGFQIHIVKILKEVGDMGSSYEIIDPDYPGISYLFTFQKGASLSESKLDFTWTWTLERTKNEFSDAYPDGVDIISLRIIASCDEENDRQDDDDNGDHKGGNQKFHNLSMKFNGPLPRIIKDKKMKANLEFASSGGSFILFELNRMVIVRGSIL